MLVPWTLQTTCMSAPWIATGKIKNKVLKVNKNRLLVKSGITLPITLIGNVINLSK